MPSTPTYGLPFEAPGDLPGHTLDGGPVGDQPILAEAVESELLRIDGDVADLQAEVARGWTPIGSGNESSNFTIDLTAGGKFPAGTFEVMRLYMRGSLSTDGTLVQVRVNSDTTSGMHRAGWMIFTPSTGATEGDVRDATSWPVAQWSTANVGLAEVTIFNTHISTQLGYRANGYRGGSTSARRVFEAGGDLLNSRLINSLQVFPFTGGITACRWWVEGFRS